MYQKDLPEDTISLAKLYIFSGRYDVERLCVQITRQMRDLLLEDDGELPPLEVFRIAFDGTAGPCKLRELLVTALVQKKDLGWLRAKSSSP